MNHNSLPRIKEVDIIFWNRVRIIPFNSIWVIGDNGNEPEAPTATDD